MRNYIVILSLIFGINWATAQVGSSEQMPQFPECENEVRENQEACFYNTIQTFFFQNFKVPEDIVTSNYKGTIYAVFEVDTIGKFKTLYIDAVSSSLKEETQRVFDALPKVKPATYSGRPTFAKYTIKIGIPLEEPSLFGTKANAIVQDKTNSA